MHRTMDFFFHGRNLGVAEFVVEVVVRIVTVFRFIFTTTISVIERSQIVSDAFRVTIHRVSGPLFDNRRNLVIGSRVATVGEELVDFSTGNLEELVPSGAGGILNGGSAIDSQRTCPEVVTTLEVGALAETHGGALQLVVDVDTGDPKGTGIQGGSGTASGNVVLGTGTTRKVPPHVTTSINTSSHIVDVQPFKRGGWRTSGCGDGALTFAFVRPEFVHLSLSRNHSACDEQRRKQNSKYILHNTSNLSL